jgi:hypothetical protein
MKNIFYYWPRYLVINLIKFYQKTLSPDHGFFKFIKPNGYCRFYPTCSEYSKQSIEKYGIIKGGIKSAWRILRCNPWNKGGVDEVD